MLTENELQWLGVSVVGVILGLVVLLVSKHVKDWLTPYRLDDQLTKEDNPALGLATVGYFLAAVIIYLGATTGPDPETVPPIDALAKQWGIDLLYALAGILLLNASRETDYSQPTTLDLTLAHNANISISVPGQHK